MNATVELALIILTILAIFERRQDAERGKGALGRRLVKNIGRFGETRGKREIFSNRLKRRNGKNGREEEEETGGVAEAKENRKSVAGRKN